MTLSALIQQSKTDREAWKYTSLAGLEDVGFKAANRTRRGRKPRGDDAVFESFPHLVFINGVWQREASSLEGLPECLVRNEKNGVTTLTLEQGTCLVTTPVVLMFINETDVEPLEIGTKLRIVLGASARLTLIEKHATSGKAPLAHVMDMEIELGPQAKLVHGKIACAGDRVAHLAKTDVRVGKGAYYDNFTLLMGGKPVRNEIDVDLAGEMAQTRLMGAMLLKGAQHADTTTRVAHNAPFGTSRQIYKSVVGGKARGVFQGKIRVAEGALKTDGYQVSRALLLSEDAEMDAKPELEIHADDVKCSHGSAVGELDEHALFYLRSRGIGPAEARALLIEAFVNELVDEIQTPVLQEAVRREVEGWLR